MHDLMADLVRDGRLDDAEACREDLWRLSAVRSGLAAVEHEAARG